MTLLGRSVRFPGFAALSAILALLAATGALLPLASADRFDHAKHAGLFPSCLACHAGIPEGEQAEYYTVSETDCAACHDGERAEAVDWGAPSRRSTNLSFSHPRHADAVTSEGDSGLDCADCHRGQSGERYMDVAAAEPIGCQGCHAHSSPQHLETEEACSDCHTSLASSPALSSDRVVAFPEPDDHQSQGFLLQHGEDLNSAEVTDNCSICHARESCSRCHLNLDQIQAASGLAFDSRVADLLADTPGEWPEPPSHQVAGYEFEHGSALDSLATCANCHAAESCAACHRGELSSFLAELPYQQPGGPAGVELVGARPPGHTTDFAVQHGAAASANEASCTTCHVQSECADCHARQITARQITARTEPSKERGFHPSNFVLRHGAEGFTVQSTCSDCHSTEAFCRDCHTQIGVALGRTGGVLGAYHDAQSDWLIRHGPAARLGLEACTSCHQQTSCLRCHSARFGLRVNPHGPGFKADRVADRSLQSCATCHFASDFGG